MVNCFNGIYKYIFTFNLKNISRFTYFYLVLYYFVYVNLCTIKINKINVYIC